MMAARLAYHHDVGPYAADAYPPHATNPKAACRNTNPDPWTDTPDSDQPTIQALKAICGRCPLQQPCYTWALGQAWLYGVWGGTTQWERKTIRRKRAEKVNA
jgi:WhiB family redox-sensing transcriptional regulator